MGQMTHYVCESCGFEAELGATQPYYVMSGSLTDKYCPKTGEIVEIFREYDQGPEEICCQAEDWQEEFGDPAFCQNCKGECLQDLEILTLDSEAVEAYKCPRCGDELQCDHMTVIFVD